MNIQDIGTVVSGIRSRISNTTAPDLKTTTHPSPIFSLTVDGEDITNKVADRLSYLTLTDNRGFDADQLDIVLDDSDGKLALPHRGAVIRLALGWKESGLGDKGSFTVDEVEHGGAPDIMTIRARSADLRSGLTTQRERSFHGKTVGDIVRTIAAENDADGKPLEPVISARLDTLVIDHIDQTNESSVNLLTRMAGMFDAIATVKNGRLMFIHAGGGVTASGKPLPTVTITRQSGDRHHFSITDRGIYTHVKATWNDIDTQIKREVTWSKADDDAENSGKATPETTTAAAGAFKTLNGTRKNRSAALRAAQKEWGRIKKIAAERARYVGVKVAYNDLNLHVASIVSYGDEDERRNQQKANKQKKRDDTKNAPPQVAIEVSADNIKVLRHPYANQTEAVRAARTEWRRLQRGMAEFSISLAHGRPEIIPEMPAIVQGFKQEIDSTDWTITRATHNLSDAGLTTKLEFEIKATEIPG